LETEAGEEDAGLKALVALLKAKYHAYQGDYVKAEQVLKAVESDSVELWSLKVQVKRAEYLFRLFDSQQAFVVLESSVLS